MKKGLIILLILIFCVLPLTISAQRVDPNEPSVWTPSNAIVKNVMTNLITFVWQFFAGLSVIMFIYAGILFVTSSGAPDRITRARMSFLWGVVGIIVAIVAYSIVAIAKRLF